MGKNGIHVGDWVEINGVGGEVTEIGLMTTTLLETGGLADQGHPTGRRISFMNGFAIRGQYFNFSTAGQWMWDEISVMHAGGRGHSRSDRAKSRKPWWKRHRKMRGSPSRSGSMRCGARA